MKFFVLLTLIALVGLAKDEISVQAAERVALRFADFGGIEDWRPAEDGEALLIEGRNGQWYRTTFWGPCPEINFAHTLGFVTSEPTGSLDKFSSILVDGVRCDFKTFERTTSPTAEPALAKPESQ